MEASEARERRIADIGALVQMNGAADATYAGKKYHLASGWKHVGSAFVLTVGGSMGKNAEREKEQAGLWEFPELTVHLDECLNIISCESRTGQVVAQQTVFDVIDKMIEASARESMKYAR